MLVANPYWQKLSALTRKLLEHVGKINSSYNWHTEKIKKNEELSKVDVESYESLV